MFIIGDTHGDYEFILDMIQELGEYAPIIHVGDFGILYDQVREELMLSQIDAALSEVNQKMYVIRGNHDNPMFWRNPDLYSNLKLLPDYTVRKIENKNVLFVGGAISVDRLHRTEGYNYWRDEKFVLDVVQAREFRDIDIVVTHTAPFGVFPFTSGPMAHENAKKDKTLLKELERERIEMKKLSDILLENNNITHHFYGHFHKNETSQVDKCEFRCVGENKVYDLRI